MMLHFVPRTRLEILFMSLSSPSESFLVTKAQMQNKIKLHFLSLLLSCSFLLGFCACRFIFYLLMHVDVRKLSLWRTNLLRVRIRGKSLQRNEASKWVFFPNRWNPWHWGSLTLCWSLTPSCLSSTAGSGIEASLNIGFISIKLLPSHKQSLLLLEWGYIGLILLNGDRHHHSTIVFFDIAFLELQCKPEMEIFCNCLPNVLADWLLSYILSTPTVGSWWRKGSVRRVMTASQSLLPLMMKLVLALFCVSGDHKVVTALIDRLFFLCWFGFAGTDKMITFKVS